MYLDNYDILKNIHTEETELKLDASVQYWCNVLLGKTVRIVEWNGLPFPQRELEIRTLIDGYCGMVNDGNVGLMVASGGMSGVTQYFDIFTNFTYSAPTAKGGTVRIGEDCVIIQNTELRNSIYPLVFRYACLLAHCDISLKMALVNLRMKNIIVSDDEGMADTFRTMYKKFYNGDTDALVDDGFTDAKNIAPTMSGSLGVMDCIDARNELLRMFYADIGVRFTKDKKERMIESEVSSDNQMLLFNISDMLHQREKASAEINALFGLNTSVRLSKEFTLLSAERSDTYDDTK